MPVEGRHFGMKISILQKAALTGLFLTGAMVMDAGAEPREKQKTKQQRENRAAGGAGAAARATDGWRVDRAIRRSVT